MRWKRWLPIPLLSLAALGGAVGPGATQDYSILAHPRPVPEEQEFRQPPEGEAGAWWGPSISATTAKCWRVEPDDPQTPVGGIHGEQIVTGVIRLPREMVERRDKNFQQGALQGLSGGGWESDLEPGDLPAGVFLAARGHPIFKVNGVDLDSSNILAGGGPALVVTAEFVHEPRMGECYFYLAAWVALDGT